MKQGAAESGAEAGDPVVRDMRVERVERADGRYLIYYAWLEASADPGMEGADDGADPGDRDV